MRIAQRLGSMAPAELALLLHAALLLARFRIALWLLPWRRVLALLPPKAAPTPRFSVHRLEQAVRTASRVTPCATCLTQALALSHLLSRNGYAPFVQIGVANEHGRFTAHAWVECGGAPLLSSAADVARYAPLVAWTPAHPDVFR